VAWQKCRDLGHVTVSLIALEFDPPCRQRGLTARGCCEKPPPKAMPARMAEEDCDIRRFIILAAAAMPVLAGVAEAQPAEPFGEFTVPQATAACAASAQHGAALAAQTLADQALVDLAPQRWAAMRDAVHKAPTCQPRLVA
jgi:hypothetical protein